MATTADINIDRQLALTQLKAKQAEALKEIKEYNEELAIYKFEVEKYELNEIKWQEAAYDTILTEGAVRPYKGRGKTPQWDWEDEVWEIQIVHTLDEETLLMLIGEKPERPTPPEPPKSLRRVIVNKEYHDYIDVLDSSIKFLELAVDNTVPAKMVSSIAALL
jgi:hypothetical protein